MDPTEKRAAPEIPSFASLRGSPRRSPVDLLVPAEPPAAPPAAPAAPRPPEWSDLLHLAVHVTRWSFTVPLRSLRRLLGA